MHLSASTKSRADYAPGHAICSIHPTRSTAVFPSPSRAAQLWSMLCRKRQVEMYTAVWHLFPGVYEHCCTSAARSLQSGEAVARVHSTCSRRHRCGRCRSCIHFSCPRLARLSGFGVLIFCSPVAWAPSANGAECNARWLLKKQKRNVKMDRCSRAPEWMGKFTASARVGGTFATLVSWKRSTETWGGRGSFVNEGSSLFDFPAAISALL